MDPGAESTGLLHTSSTVGPGHDKRHEGGGWTDDLRQRAHGLHPSGRLTHRSARSGEHLIRHSLSLAACLNSGHQAKGSNISIHLGILTVQGP